MRTYELRVAAALSSVKRAKRDLRGRRYASYSTNVSTILASCARLPTVSTRLQNGS
jgi:hypothetical protein